MKGYKDRTLDAAVGSVNREWRYMARLAIEIRERKHSPEWIERQKKRFTGIYKRLLEDPIEQVRSECKN